MKRMKLHIFLAFAAIILGLILWTAVISLTCIAIGIKCFDYERYTAMGLYWNWILLGLLVLQLVLMIVLKVVYDWQIEGQGFSIFTSVSALVMGSICLFGREFSTFWYVIFDILNLCPIIVLAWKIAEDKYEIRSDVALRYTLYRAGQTDLVQIALNDSKGYLRNAATERITDQQVLAQIALNDREAYVRRAATERITDQQVLAQIALNDSNAYVRKAAAERITDQQVLAQIALNDSNAYVRKAATERITDQQVLALILLREGEKKAIRQAAEERLNNIHISILSETFMLDLNKLKEKSRSKIDAHTRGLMQDACYLCQGTCSSNCAGDCSGGCGSYCSGDCRGGCSGDCSGGCSGDCSGGCGADCSNDCGGDCTDYCDAGCEPSGFR